MRTKDQLIFLVTVGALLMGTGYAQISPTKPLPSAFEIFVQQSTTRINTSSEVARFDSGDTSAILTAITAEETEAPFRKMSGLKIDLTNGSIKDQVYVSEAELGSLKNAADEIERTINRDPNRQCNAR